MKHLIETAEQYLLHTYNRYPIVLDYGKGVYVYDTEGRKYLDFAAGFGACALGYADKEFTEAMKEQMERLIHVSNYFYTKPLVNAAKILVKMTGMNQAFFTNSGTEAIEGAIKLARKYALQKGFEGKNEIISMNKGFHGRSMGALSITGTKAYRDPFEPLIAGVRFADYNDLESVKAKITKKTCAIIVETLQGEGGIYVASNEFLKGIRTLCDKHDLLMICDEIQCGMGRTGTYFAYEKYGIQPDVVTMAKGIGNGVAVGAFAMAEKAIIGLEAGDHGTTFGGNPLAMAAIVKTFEIFESRELISHVKEIGDYLTKCLDELVKVKDVAIERRGTGLMQGVECSVPVGEFLQEAWKSGVLLVSAGANVIRFLPPLIIEKEDVDTMIEVLYQVL